MLYQPQNIEPSEVEDNSETLVNSKQRPSDIIDNVLHPPFPEVRLDVRNTRHIPSFNKQIVTCFDVEAGLALDNRRPCSLCLRRADPVVRSGGLSPGKFLKF